MIKNKYRYVASSSTGTSPARVPARRQVKYRYLTGHQLSPGEVEGFVHNYKHLASVTVNCFAAWAPNATHRFWRIKQKRICSINCRPWELADRLHTRYSFLPVQIMNPELHSALMRSIYIYIENKTDAFWSSYTVFYTSAAYVPLSCANRLIHSRQVHYLHAPVQASLPAVLSSHSFTFRSWQRHFSLFHDLHLSPISQDSVWSDITFHNPLHWRVTSLLRCS